MLTRAETDALDAAGEYYMCALDENDEEVKMQIEHYKNMEHYKALARGFVNDRSPGNEQP